MTYALIQDNQIQSIGSLPNSARRLDTQEWVMGLATAPPELVAATGWAEVVDTARPADTATTTHDRSIELVNGTPTVVWTQRAKTPDDLAGEQQQANRSTIEDQARNAFAGNRTYAASTPTAAQTTAQVKALSRQMNGVLRLLLNELDGTN